MRHLHHELAALVFPRYVRLLDQLNYNALVARWLAHNRTLPVFKDRLAFYRYIQTEHVGDAPIDYLEFGVYQGESIRQWTELNENRTSRFVGFDTFRGLPDDWGTSCPAGSLDVAGVVPDIKDERVEFIVGLFQETLPLFLPRFSTRSRLVINNDSDLYSSTLYVLAQLNSILTPGSILIFDEFYSALHEFRAMQDYLSAFSRSVRPIAHVNDKFGRVAFLFE